MKYGCANKKGGFFQAAKVRFDLDKGGARELYLFASKFVEKHLKLASPFLLLDSENGRDIAQKMKEHTNIKNPDSFGMKELFKGFTSSMHELYPQHFEWKY